MRFLICFFALVVCTCTTVSAQRQIQFPDSSEAVFNRTMKEINPKYSNWIRSVAPQVNEKNMSEAEVKQLTTTTWSVLGSLNGQDIEALCFLVLMQASKSAQEDLKAIMAKVKSINEQKEKLRTAEAVLNEKNQTITRAQLDSFKLILNLQPGVQRVKTVPANRLVSKTEINEMKDKMKDQKDSISEMGEMESLRLQMAMDRMSKMMSTLSNLLKKISDTAQSITQNLK